MKKILLVGLLAATVASSAFGAAALRLVNGATIVTIQDNQVGPPADLNGTTGQVLYTNSNFGASGWNISVTSGDSKSPLGTPWYMDLAVVATCTSCTGDLVVSFTDTGFTGPVTGFSHDFSASLAGGAKVKEESFVSATNTQFAETTALSTISLPGGASPANTVGTAANPFSLELKQTLSAINGAGYSTDGHLRSPVPEPASVSLLGGALLAAVTVIRRRAKAAKA